MFDEKQDDLSLLKKKIQYLVRNGDISLNVHRRHTEHDQPPPNLQVTSLTEASARKLCRKHPLKCVSYTRNHIMRTYPGGMRIDSSNFNPLQFWQFGLQMVALNYQTADIPMALNAAMFEQSGNNGYTLKPRALWDPAHPLFNKFNPLSKDLNDSSALILQLTASCS